MADSSIDEAMEKILEQHEELRGEIRDLREFLDMPRPEIGVKGYHTWAATLSEKALKLHDKLFRHFRDEEEDGVLEELAMRHPGSTGKIEALKGEHGEILGGVRKVVDDTLSYSAGKEPPDARLRQRIHGILDKLGEHEATETELIQNIEYQDLGEAG
jgi:hypothetical protein